MIEIIKDNEKNQNPHSKHRARVRETVRKAGIDNLQDHNLLEVLLFYSIPRKDTNEIAHRLLDTFGSLNGVFNASYERLIEVDGMGESSALLISMIPGICKRYIQSAEAKVINLADPNDAMEYIKNKFIGEKNEVFYVVCLDSTGNLINCCKLGEGTPETVLVDKKTVLETVIRNNAYAVIFAHNHPNGVASPSSKDVDMTSTFHSLFRNIGIKFADHIIVGKKDVVSLASTSRCSILFKNTGF